MTDKKVAVKLRELGEDIGVLIEKNKVPKMKVPQRGLSNIRFDKKNNLLRMGSKTSTRNFMNVAHSKKFMQTLLIASKCHELVEKGKTASIRELYYQLKHTIDGTKENTFDDQATR